MDNKIVIGIDQSYKDTGIAISFNGKLKSATHCKLDYLKTNTDKRNKLHLCLKEIFNKVDILKGKYQSDVIVIIERIRLRSQGFININYIKGIGALNALIVDLATYYNFPVYSVDTRAWKSSIVGNSKGQKNKYGFDEKKYPTLMWCVKNNYDKYIKESVGPKQIKGVIEEPWGERYTYNDNTADSICISLYGFVPNAKLELEH